MGARNYFLSNWEIDKNVYRNGYFTLKLSPFLDTGKMTDELPLGLGFAALALGHRLAGEVSGSGEWA